MNKNNILLISPDFPPKNSAESIQAMRFVDELDKIYNINLVSTPIESGWIRTDDSLQVNFKNTEIIIVSLPFHRWIKRIISIRYFSFLRIPDSDFWLQWQANIIKKRLRKKPDLIYSRSFPLSAALIGRKMKKLLTIPWVMHLSDPWTDGPYRVMHGFQRKIDDYYERICFNEADAITVTTEQFKEFYSIKYNKFKEKIFVISNVLPDFEKSRESEAESSLYPNDKIHVVYAGSFYGERNPDDILEAFTYLKNTDYEKANRLFFWFAGNMNQDIFRKIKNNIGENCNITGQLKYKDILELQRKCDVLLSIEPNGDNKLFKGFLPSKMLDYISTGKIIFSITPKGSVSDSLCRKGFGFSVEPKDIDGIINFLRNIDNFKKSYISINPPKEFELSFNIEKINFIFNYLLKKK